MLPPAKARPPRLGLDLPRAPIGSAAAPVPMAEVPSVAEAAVVGRQRAILAAPVADGGPGIGAADVNGLRFAGTHPNGKVAVDEPAVIGDGHGPIVGIGR